MGALWQDIRYSLRLLTRSPGFAAVVILILGLGIGANTAMFSVVNAVLLRPLAFQDPDRLVQLGTYQPKHGETWFSNTLSDFVELRTYTTVFDRFVAVKGEGFVDLSGDEPRSLRSARVPAEFFAMLGVSPLLGRGFLPEEEQPGKDLVVLLSHAYWSRRYGADPNAIGKTIHFKEGTYTVVGVLPQGFRFLGYGDVWRPLALTPEETQNRYSHYGTEIVGRLKAEITVLQAETELNVISRQLTQAYPGRTEREFRLVALREHLVANVRSSLWFLFATLGFVLLIACANVANMFLARSTGRQREIAVRAALGAGFMRLARQCVIESLMLSLAGGLGAWVLTCGLLEGMKAFLPADMPRISEIRIDGCVLGFAFTVSLVTGTLIGLAPALHWGGAGMGQVLKEGRLSAGSGPRRHALHNALLVSEVALSLVLLIGAGLLIKSLRRLTTVDLGFDPQGVLCVEVSSPESIYEKPEPYFRMLTERVRQFPGVRAVAIGNLPLLGGSLRSTIKIVGQDVPVGGQTPTADFIMVSEDYFTTLRIPLLAGRVFREEDYGAEYYVALVNQAFARCYFPDRSPIDQMLTYGGRSCRIMGVVGDVRPNGFRSDVTPTLYLPYLHSGWGHGTYLLIRAQGVSPALCGAIRHELLRLSPRSPVRGLKTMEQVLADKITPLRFNTQLLSLFAALALVLASVGVYGLMAFSVSQRTQEIGIRMALGARSTDVLRSVVAQGLRLTLMGTALGLAGAVALTRGIASLLYDVSPTDPLTFALVSLVLVGVAALASYLPARRAARIDPMATLRHE